MGSSQLLPLFLNVFLVFEVFKFGDYGSGMFVIFFGCTEAVHDFCRLSLKGSSVRWIKSFSVQFFSLFVFSGLEEEWSVVSGRRWDWHASILTVSPVLFLSWVCCLRRWLRFQRWVRVRSFLDVCDYIPGCVSVLGILCEWVRWGQFCYPILCSMEMRVSLTSGKELVISVCVGESVNESWDWDRLPGGEEELWFLRLPIVQRRS